MQHQEGRQGQDKQAIPPVACSLTGYNRSVKTSSAGSGKLNVVA